MGVERRIADGTPTLTLPRSTRGGEKSACGRCRAPNPRSAKSVRLAWLGVLAIAIARLVLADGPATQSATQPATQPSAQVLAMVNDLTSDQFAVREKAQQDLERMGQPVIAQLQAILDGPLSDEARTRVRTAMRRISDRQQFGASVITIHCTDAPLQGVLEDFAHQAGADLGVHRPEIRGYLQSHKITLNLQNADFWTALQAIEDGSGLHARPENNGRLILDNMMGFWMGNLGDRTRAKIAGPCLITPQSISWFLQYGTHASNLTLNLTAMIEPKLHLVGEIQPNWLRECVDDKGNSLIIPNMPMGGGFYSGPQQWVRSLSANLRVVPGMGTKIARLKGELDFQVQTKSETVVVDDILSARNVVRNVAGSTITVQQMQSQNGQYQLHLLISGPLAAPNSAFLQNSMNSEFQILDDNDQALQQMGGGQNIDGAGQATLTLYYMVNAGWRPPNGQPVGPPKKLQCEVTTESRPMTERFELDDLELRPDVGNP